MPPKKRKAEDTAPAAAAATAANNGADNTAASVPKKPKTSNTTESPLPGDYQKLSLAQIKDGIVALMDRVPSVDGELTDATEIYTWAATLQAVIEEFNLLVCLIAAATYKWGSDRSGAADQNLSLLSGELAASQEQISTTVTPRLTNILAPVVDLVIDKSVVTHSSSDSNNNKQKVKQNVFCQKEVDPDFLELCRKILARNAKMIRQVCLANFYKVSLCIGNFLEAQEKDSNNDSRGFAY